MSNSFGVLRVPDHVHFGLGTRASIASAVAQLGRRALVIVDPFLATSPEFLQVLEDLDGLSVAWRLHSQVEPELPADFVESVAESARASAPDVVLAYGGGSTLDLAKLVALLLTHGGPLATYYGENAVPSAVLPVVAVPTTAGTGSEVTPVAVVSDPHRELKVGISDAALVPRVAVIDPELTFGAPPSVTAHSGIDALVHAVEAHTARVGLPNMAARLPVFVGRNRLSSLMALEAVRSIGHALPRAVKDGADADAREQMAWGSTLAGMAFGSAGTHLSHALQYPIGALTHTPHGLGTGLMLPYVLQACIDASVDPLAEVADALGVQAQSPRGRAQAAIDRVAAIADEIGLPRSLADIGVTRRDIPRLAELSAGVTRLAGNASRPATPDLLENILLAALAGDRESLR